MAHGQSNKCRRAGWLAVACGLAAIGCKGPDKDEAAKRLDPATKQKLIGLDPAPRAAAPDRSMPTSLPKPQVASTNPAPNPNPLPTPLPNSVGTVAAPTRVNNAASFGGPQRVDDLSRPQMPAEGVVQTGGVAAKPPAPVVPAPLTPGPLPVPGALPEPGGVAIPTSVLPAAPVGSPPLPTDLPQFPRPTPPPPPAPAFPPLPGESKFPEVQSPAALPPLVNDLPPLGGR